MVEVLAACLQLECRGTEVPITFFDRRSGRSKLSRVEIFKGMMTLLRLGMERLFSSGVRWRKRVGTNDTPHFLSQLAIARMKVALGYYQATTTDHLDWCETTGSGTVSL